MDETPRERIDIGLLVIRVGLGLMFLGHGLPKLLGGPAKWAKVGSAMGALGIHFAPTFWGFMAGCSEAGGGLLLALGIFFRPGLVLLIGVMCVALPHHLQRGDPYGVWSHPVEDAISLIGLFIIGPGRFTVRRWLFGGKEDEP